MTPGRRRVDPGCPQVFAARVDQVPELVENPHMNSIRSVALSGLQAAQQQLAAAANNVANADTPGFHRQRVEQQAVPGGGTMTSLAREPQAGGSLVQDLVDQKMALYSFKANLQVLRADAQMQNALLDERA